MKKQIVTNIFMMLFSVITTTTMVHAYTMPIGSQYPSSDTFLRWLATLKHCTGGQTCAITVNQTCEWSNTHLSKQISEPTVLIQNHRGDNNFATFILNSGGQFVNIAQENETAAIPLKSNPFPESPREAASD